MSAMNCGQTADPKFGYDSGPPGIFSDEVPDG